MPRPPLPSWPTLLTTLAVLIIHALVLWILADLLFSLFGGRPTTETITPGPYLIAGQTVALIALVLLCLPLLKLLRRGHRPRDRHCPRCWYTLDPALGLKCSECGHEAENERALYKPRHRWKRAAALLCLIALVQITWLETRIRAGGWVAAIPTEALIVGMPWVPKSWLMGGPPMRGPRSGENWTLCWRPLNERQWNWAMQRAADRVMHATTPQQCMDRYELVFWLGLSRDLRDTTRVLVPWRASLRVATQWPDAPRSPVIRHAASALGDAVSADPAIAPDVQADLTPIEPFIVAELLSDSEDQRYPADVLLSLMAPSSQTIDLLEQNLESPRAAGALVSAVRRSELAADRVASVLAGPANNGRDLVAVELDRRTGAWRAEPSVASAMIDMNLPQATIKELVLLIVGPPTVSWRGIPAGMQIITQRPELSETLQPLVLNHRAELIAEFVPEAMRMCDSGNPAARHLGLSIIRRIVFWPGFPESADAPRVLALLNDPDLAAPLPDDAREEVEYIASRLQERIPRPARP